MERSFFEKLAKSNGFPNPSDEQIEEIKKLHTKNTISDDCLLYTYDAADE